MNAREKLLNFTPIHTNFNLIEISVQLKNSCSELVLDESTVLSRDYDKEKRLWHNIHNVCVGAISANTFLKCKYSKSSWRYGTNSLVVVITFLLKKNVDWKNTLKPITNCYQLLPGGKEITRTSNNWMRSVKPMRDNMDSHFSDIHLWKVSWVKSTVLKVHIWDTRA